MKTVLLSLAILFLAFPQVAQAADDRCKTTELASHIEVPERFVSEYSPIYMTDLCPPAAAEDERYYAVWMGGECDTRVNLGVLRLVPGKVHAFWFEEGVTGSVGYFNYIDVDTYGLTLIDYHGKKYRSMLFSVLPHGALLLIFNKLVAIPLPSGVGLH